MARPRNNPGDLAELPTELRTDRPKGDQIREILEKLTRSLAVGTVLAIWAGRATATMLFGLKPYDPLSIAGAVLLLSAVAVAASYVPARRAAALEPMAALRDE